MLRTADYGYASNTFPNLDLDIAFARKKAIETKKTGIGFGFGVATSGQIGNGITGVNPTVPSIFLSNNSQSSTRHEWLDLAAGLQYSLGIKSDGSLWTWGSSAYHNQPVSNPSTPTFINSQNTWIKIVTGDGHVAGIKSDRTLWTWGRNDDGRLGLGDTIHRSSPVQVRLNFDSVAGPFSSNGWADISCGYDHMVGITSTGDVCTWGRNDYYQLGDGTVNSRSRPVIVFASGYSTLNAIKQVGAGFRTSVAINSDNTIYAWGFSSADHPLGIISSFNQISPTQANSPKLGTQSNTFVQIATNPWTPYYCALRGDGKLFTTNTSIYNANISTSGATLTGFWKKIAVGGSNSLDEFSIAGIKENGTLWLINDIFRLGNLQPMLVVTQNTGYHNLPNNRWNSVTCGFNHTLVTKNKD